MKALHEIRPRPSLGAAFEESLRGRSVLQAADVYRAYYATRDNIAWQDVTGEPTYTRQGVTFRRGGVDRVTADEVVNVIGALHRACAEMRYLSPHRNPRVAVTITRREYRLLQRTLSYESMRQYLGEEGAEPSFCGVRMVVTEELDDPLLQRVGW